MTRRRWPRRVITCADCGQRKPHAAHGKCSACTSRERRALEGARTLTHGYGGYTDGCRCDACKAAKAAYMAGRRGQAFLNTGTVEGVTHGTRSAYEERGCRCGECVSAQPVSSRYRSKAGAA